MSAMSSNLKSWRSLYPSIYDEFLNNGVEESVLKIKIDIVGNLDLKDVSIVQRDAMHTVKVLAHNERRLSTESYYLVLQISEMICIMNLLGLFSEKNVKSQFEKHLVLAFDSVRNWLIEDMSSARRSVFSGFWPFSELLN